MKKIVLLIGILILISSCSNQDKLITNKSVGEIKLGKEFSQTYDESSIDITLDDQNIVITIIVSNANYKTVDGFGVGTSFNDMISKYDFLTVNEDFNVSKGKIPIIKLGKSVVYDGIIFIDSNEDNIVDYIILSFNDN